MKSAAVSATASPLVPPSTRPDGDSATVRGLIFIRDRGIFVLFLALLVVFAVWAQPYFASIDNGILIANAAALTAVYAAGVAVGIFCGALDLSIPGVAALTSCACGLMITRGLPTALGIVTALALGGLIGLVNGLISLRGFNPIVVTIGTLSVLTGMASVVAGGYTISGLDELTFMGTQRYLGIPGPVWIVALLYLVVTVFVTRTRDGLRMMAAGGNPEAVRRSGIHSDRYRVVGFVISGFCAALGGLITTALVTEANPGVNPGIIFTALTAVALAGVSLGGGRGSLPRVLVGSVILATISNGLTIKGIQPYWGTAVTGLLLLGAITLEKWISMSVSRRLVATAQASAHTGTR
jgi:ribose transport system permease protein